MVFALAEPSLGHLRYDFRDISPLSNPRPVRSRFKVLARVSNRGWGAHTVDASKRTAEPPVPSSLMSAETTGRSRETLPLDIYIYIYIYVCVCVCVCVCTRTYTQRQRQRRRERQGSRTVFKIVSKKVLIRSITITWIWLVALSHRLSTGGKQHELYLYINLFTYSFRIIY